MDKENELLLQQSVSFFSFPFCHEALGLMTTGKADISMEVVYGGAVCAPHWHCTACGKTLSCGCGQGQ